MARINRCDKCGHEQIGPLDEIQFEQIAFNFDLCDECIERLRNWLKENPNDSKG